MTQQITVYNIPKIYFIVGQPNVMINGTTLHSDFNCTVQHSKKMFIVQHSKKDI